MSSRPALIFDVDGTLIDSQAAIIETMRRTYDQFNLPGFNPGKVRRIVGLSLYNAMVTLVPDQGPELYREMEEAYKTHFKMTLNGHHREVLFDGIRHMVSDLDQKSYLMSIATGNSQRGLKRVLDENDLNPYFISLQTADDNPSKPHPAMVERALADMGVDGSNAIMIGDTSFDMLMARNAGVAAVGVAWGYHEKDELRAAGAQHIARDVDHLHQILKEWRVAA